MAARITPGSRVQRKEQASEALLDALLELRSGNAETALVLASIAVLHLGHVADEDGVQRLLRLAADLPEPPP